MVALTVASVVILGTMPERANVAVPVNGPQREGSVLSRLRMILPGR